MEWSPRAGETASLATLGVLLGLVTPLLDPLGRVLVGVAAVLLLALAVRDRLLRPRLAAGPAGVAVRRLTGTTELPWARLQVRVRDSRRFGLRSRLLELDTAAGPDDDGDLVLLGRRDLGADPGEVARVLRTLRPRRGPRPPHRGRTPSSPPLAGSGRDPGRGPGDPLDGADPGTRGGEDGVL